MFKDKSSKKRLMTLVLWMVTLGLRAEEVVLKDPTKPYFTETEETKAIESKKDDAPNAGGSAAVVAAAVAAEQEAIRRKRDELFSVKLNIKSIIFGPQRKIAIVNNKVVHIGSSIAGYHVSDISEREVVFSSEFGNRTEKLQFDEVKEKVKMNSEEAKSKS